jgi:hypothetical protein
MYAITMKVEAPCIVWFAGEGKLLGKTQILTITPIFV